MVRSLPRAAAQWGTSMIEVLVTIVIIAFGLLGLAGLQSRMQVSEVESYQRAQALMLLNDMANRIETNRNSAVVSGYVTTGATPAYYGSGMTCPTTSGTLLQTDVKDWCLALQGAAEVEGAGASKLGAVIGGRGCVESLGNREYLVTVAWQGMVPLTAPPASVTCGQNLYDGPTGAACTGDLCRRVVTTVVRLAALK